MPPRKRDAPVEGPAKPPRAKAAKKNAVVSVDETAENLGVPSGAAWNSHSVTAYLDCLAVLKGKWPDMLSEDALSAKDGGRANGFDVKFAQQALKGPQGEYHCLQNFFRADLTFNPDPNALSCWG